MDTMDPNMPPPPAPNSTLLSPEPRRRSSGRSLAISLVLLIYVVAVGFSVVLVTKDHLPEGILGMLLVLASAPIAVLLIMMMTDRSPHILIRRVDELTRAVKNMSEQTALSDDARRVLHRDSERQLLRQAIEEDIVRSDWDAAMVLVKELADRFGYRADAEEFRVRIERARAETLAKQVADSIGVLDGFILQRRWDAAYEEAARIRRLYPDSPRSETLRTRVDQARGMYKQDLERRFLLAAKDGQTEDAVTLLKELDNYLTPEEAEPLRELARGIIGKHRDNLGAQFKLAVQDRRWREAVKLGEDIIAQFPNSRMAQEVRDLIDGVRQRANAMG